MSELGIPVEKKTDQKHENKNRKLMSNCHMQKTLLARSRTFVQTPFSHSTLIIEQKTRFRSTSSFGVTKITSPIGLQK